MAKIKFYQLKGKSHQGRKIKSIVGDNYLKNYKERQQIHTQIAHQNHNARIKAKEVILLAPNTEEEPKKYLAIAKIITETMGGISTRILTRFSDDKAYLDEWLKGLPKASHIILENNKELQNFFESFEDFLPVTAEEKAEALKAYEEFMKQN